MQVTDVSGVPKTAGVNQAALLDLRLHHSQRTYREDRKRQPLPCNTTQHNTTTTQSQVTSCKAESKDTQCRHVNVQLTAWCKEWCSLERKTPLHTNWSEQRLCHLRGLADHSVFAQHTVYQDQTLTKSLAFYNHTKVTMKLEPATQATQTIATTYLYVRT